ncbi:hypothetical protein [Wenyingzhuangia sp. IMCC45467]
MKIKHLIILVWIILLIVLGSCIYFVSQFSAVYPPIKEYKFQSDLSNIRTAIIKTLDNPEKFEYKFTDVVGNAQNGFVYHVDFKIKGPQMNYDYNISFYNENGKNEISKIKLIGAFDKINKTGGFKIKDNDVPRLVSIFDSIFIVNLKINLKNK